MTVYAVSCDFVFFFQAEDGIRDLTVTGVQTCALPISKPLYLRAPTSTLSLGFRRYSGLAASRRQPEPSRSADLVRQGRGSRHPIARHRHGIMAWTQTTLRP